MATTLCHHHIRLTLTSLTCSFSSLDSIKVLLLIQKAVNGSHPIYSENLISIYKHRSHNPGQRELELCRKPS